MAVYQRRVLIRQGRDNVLGLILRYKGTAQNLSGITRMELTLAGKTFDSVTHGAGSGQVFDWTDQPNETGEVHLRPGQVLVADDIGWQGYLKLVVFDVLNDDGITWVWHNTQTRVYATIVQG